jgi:hypothetical protein
MDDSFKREKILDFQGESEAGNMSLRGRHKGGTINGSYIDLLPVRDLVL